MKLNDLVKYKEKLGVIVDKRVHVLSYTSFILYKVEFKENEPSEWINEVYLTKVRTWRNLDVWSFLLILRNWV